MYEIFDSARAKLTLWYLLLIILISGTLSLLIFFRVSSVLGAEYERLEDHFQQQLPELAGPVRQRVIAARRESIADLVAIRRAIFFQLVTINAGIIVVFSVGGYALSGITLKPIAKAHQEQKRFVGDAAHELKTPITALKATVEANLLNPKLSKQSKQILEANLVDISNLEKLTKSLLQLAKVSEQATKTTAVDLGKTVEQAVHFMKASANKKNVKLIPSVPAKVMVQADTGLLFDLLLLLLDNAIKYSKTKGLVEIKHQRRGNKCVLTIQDYGVGIRKQDISHIFDRFYRADQARTQSSTSGYGLGLAVAKNIVKQFHGDIKVTSTEGKGSIFLVVIPRA